ncbi:uncharacterized protein BO72DRAFT_287819 [Aspergillus fijiensis CBS 313.89]|uniref:Uncharacterized protein n=1 Tax=Aspergillus fijiensis CBS 313.89 TaxID=1448319 RepID=A0A8G1RXV5_9EURO|nr:uncharacterized protein BO72DRAFT_287819 [Aspergillus fijiensis CBS 313.89]RAK80742.1 hypothetical protein BO72DRAFT_287819 [Aspergillus fijiensis CBS 313.89]
MTSQPADCLVLVRRFCDSTEWSAMHPCTHSCPNSDLSIMMTHCKSLGHDVLHTWVYAAVEKRNWFPRHELGDVAWLHCMRCPYQGCSNVAGRSSIAREARILLLKFTDGSVESPDIDRLSTESIARNAAKPLSCHADHLPVDVPGTDAYRPIDYCSFEACRWITRITLPG